MPPGRRRSCVNSTSWPVPGSPWSPGHQGSASRLCSTSWPGCVSRRRAAISAPPCHYVTQRPFLEAGTLRDALTLGRPAPDAELWQALRAVEVDGVVAALDDGLSTTIGDDGFGLSAGQRQRLALARAWLSTDTVLLLDEPTAHIDPSGAQRLARLVDEMAERRVVIAATHRGELLEHADQHVHLVPSSDLQDVAR